MVWQHPAGDDEARRALASEDAWEAAGGHEGEGMGSSSSGCWLVVVSLMIVIFAATWIRW